MDSNSYKTLSFNRKDIEKEWVLVDATNQALGRLASQVAKIIRGKHKPSFSPHADVGDHVVVINAEKIRMTGKKWTDRLRFFHSGYMGSQRRVSSGDIKNKNPERLIELAVRGMLPKNRLGSALFNRLHVHVGSEHNYEAQKIKTVTLV